MGNFMSSLTSWESHIRAPKLVDRETGELVLEPAPIFGTVEMSLLYSTRLGQYIARWSIVQWWLRRQGKKMKEYADKRASKSFIPKLIKEYGINVEECAKPPEEYATLNDFFSRYLKGGLRPVAEPNNPRVAVQPADSRLVVYSSVPEAERLWIKGQDFTIHKLLGSSYDAGDWENACIAVNRLAPMDYHRLHAPVEGSVKNIVWLGKTLYAVTSPAAHSSVDIYGEAERAVVEFETPMFGTVMMAIIGATQVGSIILQVDKGDTVKKGQEVGYFQYGGSVVIVLFHHGAIRFDEDLLSNSRNSIETKVKVGQSMGTATEEAGSGGKEQ